MTPLLVLIGLSCAPEPSSAPPAVRAPHVKAFVSVLPQAYFVRRIGGTAVSVEVLVQPGLSPETYEITPRQMDRLGQARLFLRTGVPFEAPLLPKIAETFPRLKVVDVREGIALLPVTGHAHAAGHDHGQEELDPHIWLDPVLAKTMARNVYAALAEALPKQQEIFAQNLRAVEADLDAVDARIAAVLEPYQGQTLYVFHPAYGYFAQRYGLIQESVQREGKGPGIRHLNAVAGHMEADAAKVLFVQPQFSTREAQAIAEAVGGKVVTLDPLAESYLSNLEAIAKTVARTFQDAGK